MAYVGARVVQAHGNIKKGQIVRLIESYLEADKTKWHLVEYDAKSERLQQSIPNECIRIYNIHGLKGDI